MIEEKRYAYQPEKHFCLIACVTAWHYFVLMFYLLVNPSFTFRLAHVVVIFHGELKLHFVIYCR